MPQCYICFSNFACVNSLIRHMKLIHSVTATSKFVCCEGSCIRLFDRLESFKRHLKCAHSFPNILEQIPSTPKNTTNSINELKNNSGQSSSDSPVLCSVDSFDNYSMQHSDSTPDLDDSFHSTNQLEITLSHFKDSFQNQIASLLAGLYSKPTLTRSHVQEIAQEFGNLLSEGGVDILKERVLDLLVKYGADVNEKTEIAQMFSILQDPFSHMSTEHVRLKHFEISGFYIAPERYCIGRHFTTTSQTSGKACNTITMGQFIPLRKVLKAFFQMPDVLNKTVAYINSLSQASVISNFVQGALWQKILLSYVGKLVLPLFVYFDDYEIGNPLGSHAGVHKLGAMYVSIPCFPPEYQSALQNIFLLLLFHSEDRKTFGNASVFKPAVEELTFLATTGIEIELSESKQKVYFALTLVLGDNLGLHSVLGFVESFSANYACRMCKATKIETRNLCTEANHILRTEQNYIEDVELNNVTATGIREACVWNSVPNFHVCENQSIDIMHDFFEGICLYTMSEIMHYYIIECKMFSSDTLNSRIQMFRYSPLDDNPPPTIPYDRLVNKNWSMSAAEMWCFSRLCALIIGDKVPRKNPFWDLYISLMNVIEIITARGIQEDCSILLETLVSEHHNLYMDLFGKHLKPKHHFAVHYGHIMRMVGPLRGVWSMRFESKHRQSKLGANVVASRRNIPLTLATKHQLQLCNSLIVNSGFSKVTEVGSGKELNVHLLENYESFLPSLPVLMTESVYVTSTVTVGGIRYIPGVMLVVGYEEHCPVFGKVQILMLNSDRELCFVLQKHETLGFDEHFFGYEVKEVGSSFCMMHSEINELTPMWKYIAANGSSYVPFKS